MSERKEFELNGKLYHLHYSIGRLERIEQTAGISALTFAVNLESQKYPTIAVLKQYFAMGLMEDNGVYAPLKAALEFAEKQLEESGYVAIMTETVNALTEDCGFLFQNA